MIGNFRGNNVLVSGLINPFGAPGRVLDLILAGELQLLYDDRILEEYAQVLGRPRYDFYPVLVRHLLDYFRHPGLPIAGLPLGEVADQAPDQDDLVFAEVTVSRKAAALITGNPKHFRFLDGLSVSVQLPAELIRTWTEQLDSLSSKS